jgi:oxygen-dependent protoporphyrinogen oxidase
MFMRRIAIIGGGISGLSAAFALEEARRAGSPLEYVLFESSPRLGGVLQTENVEGFTVEAGPDSFLTEKSWATDFCRQVGLGDQLVGSNDAQRKTYILRRGKLIAIPDGLMFLVPTRILPTLLSPLFSPRTKLRMASEWLQSPHHPEADESIASFVARHYGAEVVDYLADPLLSGIYGGQASQLSLRAVLPRFAEMESKYGSLGRALLAHRGATRLRIPPRPIFTSLKNGMQQMVQALVAHLAGQSLLTHSPVRALRRQDEGWLVSTATGAHRFDAVILSTSAQSAAILLEDAPSLATELRGVAYASTVVVVLGYRHNVPFVPSSNSRIVFGYKHKVRQSLPRGFGFLVPRSEGRRLLAATFVHNKFPHRAPSDCALIRCFLGGTRDEQVLQLSDEQILRTIREELRQIIGLTAEPLFSRVYKWKATMAQYNVGHLERLERIERLRRQLPGLALAGNAYRGIGVPDCIRSGQEAAREASGVPLAVPSPASA